MKRKQRCALCNFLCIHTETKAGMREKDKESISYYIENCLERLYLE